MGGNKDIPVAGAEAQQEGRGAPEGREKGDAARAQLEELQEQVDETGDAKEYVETFKKSTDLEVFMQHLELGMKYGDTQGFSNFENWLVIDGEALAGFFDEFGYTPRGKGRLAFVQGLRAKKTLKNSRRATRCWKRW